MQNRRGSRHSVLSAFRPPPTSGTTTKSTST